MIFSPLPPLTDIFTGCHTPILPIAFFHFHFHFLSTSLADIIAAITPCRRHATLPPPLTLILPRLLPLTPPADYFSSLDISFISSGRHYATPPLSFSRFRCLSRHYFDIDITLLHAAAISIFFFFHAITFATLLLIIDYRRNMAPPADYCFFAISAGCRHY
jgi:hypothetical protein